MKIFHCSDLHFGQHQKQIITSFMNDIALANPEVIIISGDITHRATEEQYEMLTRFLNQLNAHVLLVPGNHDIPLYHLWARMFYPFARYKKHVSPSLDCQFSNDSVRLLGVNSVNPYRVKNGRLTSATLNRIEDFFASDFDGLNLLFFHHNFHFIEGMHKPLANFYDVIDCLKKVPVHIVCTGHLHYANISEIKAGSNKTLVLHAGSLLCPRTRDNANSYYQIKIHQKSCRVLLRTFEDSEFITSTEHDKDWS